MVGDNQMTSMWITLCAKAHGRAVHKRTLSLCIFYDASL